MVVVVAAVGLTWWLTVDAPIHAVAIGGHDV